MKLTHLIIAGSIAMIALASCKDKKDQAPATTNTSSGDTTKIKEENISYTVNGADDSVKMDGYIAYDENIKGTRPAILVVHEWWGLNDYAKMRARELAKLGYIAMAIDLYGNGRRGTDPQSAGALAGQFYSNFELARQRFHAALVRLKQYPEADTTRTAAIGYCFGGAMVINMAKMGEDLDGVVSFHGNLAGVPTDKSLLKAQILVCNGADDSFVPAAEIAAFKKQMDSIGAKYIFKSYPGAVHAFTNPEATAMGEKFKIPIKYNAAADSASWSDMKDFFKGVF